MRLRINWNTRAVVKTAGLLSNTVILTANAYLLTSGIARQLKDRKHQRVSQGLELGAQVARAVAGLTSVIMEAAENGQRTEAL
ncbi:MAG: hypothetical protein ACE5D7_02315 [Fidelibacterota bacterium]